MDSRAVRSELDASLSDNLNRNEQHAGEPHSAWREWDGWIRRISLTFCLVSGAITAYTTRYFVNGDALAYLDMADAFGKQRWADLVNLHYSPGYPILLGLAAKLSGVDSPNELFVAKAVNFLCYVFALLALEVLLQQLKTDEEFAPLSEYQHVDWILFRTAAYGLFLVSSLIYIRIQVVSPDMLGFCFTLLVAAVLVWIKKSSDSHAKFVVLGLVIGFGYLFRTPFFLMSAVFIVLAALYCTSIRKALTGILVAAIVFLVVSSSLWVPLSSRLGRFSFGESGSFNYSRFVSGSGNPIRGPDRVFSGPNVDVYSGGSVAATYPSGFDLSYWTEGVTPSFDPHAQVSVLSNNLIAVLNLNPLMHLLFLVWLCLQALMGASFSARFSRPSLAVLFGLLSVAGIGLFCLVLVESRYVAPHLFLGLTAILLWPRYGPNHRRVLKTARAGLTLITAFLIATVIVSLGDQTLRSLYDRDAKQSHRRVFLENLAVKDFLNSRGVSRNDLAAILGTPSIGNFWARLTGVRAIATIPDQHEFLAVSPQVRAEAIHTLRARRFRVILGTGDAIAELEQEGWSRIPNTSNCFLLFLE